MRIGASKLYTLLIAGESAAIAYKRCGGKLKAYGLYFAALLLLPFAALADVVNVYEETECGGEMVRIAERSLETGRKYETSAAPAVSGWIFTHWTISTTQDFADRDEWGRALDVVPFDLYESTTLTAHYLPVAQDSDGDGVADGSEIYWYGDLSQGADSDTDDDGITFAEELARGTNPIMAESGDVGPVAWVAGKEWLLNPNNYGAITIRSEPEGALFATMSEVYRPGTRVSTHATGVYDPETTTFAYWSFNGERLADEWGRAESEKEVVTDGSPLTIVAYAASDYETRMKLYWYGTTEVEMTSDTDGDGVSFADELVRGTNPLMAETKDEGPVKYVDTETKEFNLQPYEQVLGAVIDEKYEVFPTFEGAVTPTVADVNGDGIFDIVVEVAGGETVVYLGCGGAGNPEFRKVAWDANWAAALAAARPESLDGLAFDVPPPADALSWTFGDADGDGVKDLLVSDAEGRIWIYLAAPRGEDALGTVFVLQHKVWGGSFAGFANGLRLATVDWDDDGDLDCLAGTSEGKLMLLRDPKVGRPTNVRARVGVDSVLLVWDPNAQSRIRGYRVYRGVSAPRGEDASGTVGALIAEPTLPTYRDAPPEVTDYDYAVSSISRHYTAGNSTPIISESMPTEAIRASMGKVAFRWGDAAGFVGEEVAVGLAVENSLNLSGAGLVLKIGYDPTILTPVRVETSGLTEGVAFAQSAAGGVWTISASGGEIASGSGTMFTLVFTGAKATDATEVSLMEVAAKSASGKTVTAILPSSNARVALAVRTPEEPPEDPTIVVPYSRGDLDGDGRLTKDDLKAEAKLMNGNLHRGYTVEELRAGDLNGDGRIDQNDYKLLKDEFRRMGIVNGGVKLEVLE